MDGFQVQKGSIPADHVGMCKFGAAGDVGYRRVLEFITNFCDDVACPTREDPSPNMLTTGYTNVRFGSTSFSGGYTPLPSTAALQYYPVSRSSIGREETNTMEHLGVESNGKLPSLNCKKQIDSH